MKKLLSMLTISTLTASVPAPLLANTVQTRVNRDFATSAKDVTTGFAIKIKYEDKWIKKVKPQDNHFDVVDNKWYFVVWRSNTNENWRIIKFKNNSENTKKIDSIGNYSLIFHWWDWPHVTHLYLTVSGIRGHAEHRWEDNTGINYFNSVYRWDGVGEPELPIINSSTGQIIKWIVYKTSFQQNINFFLADSYKTAKWSNYGMRLTVDGETNININNQNVTDVYWDGVKQKMLDHKVNINVKPETTEKNHKLVIKYDINGTKYTSEDIDVVMAAKIASPKSIVKENLSDVIKFDNNNDLGNILDKNDDTIFAAITNKNSRSVDFTQIEITGKTDTQATLSAIEGSESYAGSAVVKYNVVPATTVDLKIDLTSWASGVQIDKDYLAQLDNTKMTNKVDTFYYANGKIVIKIKQPSIGNVITGVVFGCDDKWNKTSQPNTIDLISGLEIDKGQYGSVDGRYLIELKHKDLPTHTKNIYLQISSDKEIKHYWNTDNGKQFERWAEDNGYKNIRGSSAIKLNNLFELSQTWKQSLKHLDLKLNNFVVDNIKNVSQDEIDNYKTKLLSSVKAQVEKYAPNVVKNTDYVIGVVNLVAGDWTTSKDVKVQAVDRSTKLLSFTAKTIPAQQKEQPTPPTPDNKKGGDSKLWIIGVVVGVLAGLGLAYWLFKSFVFDKYFLPKIKKFRHDKLVEKVRKEEAEKETQNNKGGEE